MAEEPGIIGLAQGFCPKGEGVIGHIVFESVAHGVVELALERHVAEAHIVVVVGTHGIVLAWCEGTAAGGGVGGLNVEIAQAFEITVCKDGNGGVAFHRERFASVKFPFRQPTPLLSHARHRAQHVGLPLGINEREQLVDVAVGVPEGEHGVAVVPRSDAVALHQGVASVGVLQDVGVEEQMIERSVEHGLFFLRATLYEYARKVGVPFFLSLGADLVKGLARKFGFEIAPRSFDADE